MKLNHVVIVVAAMGWAITSLFQSVQAPRRVVHFSGYDWFVKNSNHEHVGPGPNYFTGETVEVTPGALKIRLVERDRGYYCGELICRESLGFGTYEFTVESDLSRLAPNLVLGMFTWSDQPEFANRELDVEVSRWGDPANPWNGQFVIQPADVPGNLSKFAVPHGAAPNRYSITWLPELVEFRVAGPNGSTLASKTFTKNIPIPGGENVRINLWLKRGHHPGEGSREVVISKFEFHPKIGSEAERPNM